MSFRQTTNRILPRSLLARTLVLMLVAIVLAQALSSFLWYFQVRQYHSRTLLESSHYLAQDISASIKQLQQLPEQQQQETIEQRRRLGGNQYSFTSLNSPLSFQVGPQNRHSLDLLEQLESDFQQELAATKDISLWVMPYNQLTRQMRHGPKLNLPTIWSATVFNDYRPDPSLIVLQLKQPNGQWLAVVSLLPPPYFELSKNYFGQELAWFMGIMTTFLLLFTFSLIRSQTRPLRRLAKAASSLTIDLFQPPLKEEGSDEICQATRAFNSMQSKLKRYIEDRELLFRSISHDLKTPITRLRLRAELLDDERTIDAFNRDLDDLELLAKGALQTVKETDIHENLSDIDIMSHLEHITEPYRGKVVVKGSTEAFYRGKPLAIKRCIANLIDNGIKYGKQVEVYVLDDDEELCLLFVDHGPGIPEQHHLDVFNPYVRLATDKDGSGLGLGIARNIAHAHGGDVTLQNLPQGGLEVKLQLPHVN